MFRKLILLSFVMVGVVQAQQLVQRPNIESAQRALQERYIRFVQAAQTMELPGADQLNATLTFPARVYDGKKPGLFPEDCFYEKDLFDPETGQANLQITADLIVDMLQKMVFASDWGQYWVAPAWQGSLDGRDADNGRILVINDIEDYYPNGLTVSPSNYLDVFGTIVFMLEEMSVLNFQIATDTIASTLPLQQSGQAFEDKINGVQVTCADIKSLTMDDYNADTPTPVSQGGAIVPFSRVQRVLYEEDAQTLDQTWEGLMTTNTGFWSIDYSLLSSVSGTIEIYGRLEESPESVNGEPLLAAMGAPHTAYDEWFTIDSGFSMNGGGTYDSPTYADPASSAFVIGCPTAPGLANKVAAGWDLYGRAIFKPAFIYFPSRALIACSTCGDCTGAAGVCSNLDFGSLSYVTGLGRSSEGPVGDLRLYTQTISPLSASPFDLQLNVNEDRAEILLDGDYGNILKQVVTDQTLVDVEVTSPYREYVIRYYDSADKGSLVDGFYQPDSADAFKTVTVTNPATPQYATTATTDTQASVFFLNSPNHGLPLQQFFQAYVDSTGPELPTFAVNGPLSRRNFYVLYTYDANNLTVMWFNSGAGGWSFDQIVEADDSQTLSIQSPQPFGTLGIVEDTGTRMRTIQYTSNTTSTTGNHVITLSDDMDGEIRNHSSVQVVDTVDSSLFSTTITESDANSNVILKTTTNYKIFPWNIPTSEARQDQAEILSVVEDPDGEARTTTYVYYEDFANDGDNYGKLKSVQYFDGSWEAYEYDSDGYVSKTVRPWKDSTLSLLNAGNHVVTSTRGTIPDEDGDTEDESLETIIELIDGSEVARSYELVYTDTSGALSRTAMIEAAAPGAAWDAASNLRTDRWTYFDGDFNGDMAKEKRPDGTMTFYSYAIDPVSGEKTTTMQRGEPNGTENAIVDGTQAVTVTNSLGGQVSRIETDIASGITLSSAVTPAGQFDGLGRPLTILYLDGTSELRNYQDCCGIDTVTDRTGLVRTTTEDMEGEIESVSANGITTEYTDGYDTDNIDGIVGFTRTTTVDGRGTNDSVVYQVETYTPSGRLLASLDPRDSINRLTTFAESLNGSGQWERAITLPNTAISTQVFHRDGELYEMKFDGEVRQRYLYAVESDNHDGITFNARTETLIRLGESNETAEWIKTYRDMLGRAYKVEMPDPNGGVGTFEALTFFNNKGQRVREVDPDGQQTLYVYNAEGELEETILDVDKNGTVDYTGTDRVVRSQRTVLNDPTNGNVVRQTVSVWETDSLNSATVIQQTDTATDGLDVWSQAYGLTTHINRTFNGSGSVTETTTRPDATTETVITVNGFQTSAVMQNPTEGTLSSITNTPDDFDRVYQQADNLIGVTWTYTYFDNGQLHQSVSPESDTGAGDAQTTTYSYDVMDRVLDVTLPDTTVQSRRYHPDGTLKMTFGSQTYPVEFTYDRQERQRTMKTWKDFDEANEVGVSGAATTIWNYNPLGLLESKEDDDANSTDYTYTGAGRQLTKTNARAIVTTYGYDPDTRDLLTLTYSDGTPGVTYTYDRRGRARTIADASGSRTLAYEDGQLMDEAYTSGALAGYRIDRGQDSLDRYDQLTLRSGLDAIYKVGYGHDGASRLGTVTHKSDAVTYAYTPGAELRQTQTFNNGSANQMTVNLRYDKLNRLKSRESVVTGGIISSYAYQYNDLNQRDRMTLADNSYWQFGYDPLGQVNSAVHKNASDTPFPGRSFGFTFDEIGNRTQTNTNGRVATYTPNNLNEYDERQVPRAVDVRGDANATATVTVNSNATTRLGDYFHHELDLTADGNVAQQTAITITGTLPDGGDNNAPRVADAQISEYLPPNPEDFTHDSDGNLTNDGKWHYTWDAENRLIEMETLAIAYGAGAPRLKLEFEYDSQSRRFSKKVYEWDSAAYQLKKDTAFFYDGWNLIHEITDLQDGSQSEKSYVWGNDLSGSMQGAGGVGGLLMATHAQQAVFYPTFDGNGNVMSYVDGETGESVALYEYGAFGESIKASGRLSETFDLRFSTKYQDAESGLYYYGFRFYDPKTGRWLNKDPIEELGGLNLFGMIGNDPVNAFDVLGLVSNRDIFRDFTATINFCDENYPIVSNQLEDILNEWVDDNKDIRNALRALQEAAKTIKEPFQGDEIFLPGVRSDTRDQLKTAKFLAEIFGDEVINPNADGRLIADIVGMGAGASIETVEFGFDVVDKVTTYVDLAESPFSSNRAGIAALVSVATVADKFGGPAGKIGSFYSDALKGIDSALSATGRRLVDDTLTRIQIHCSCTPPNYRSLRPEFDIELGNLKDQLK